MTPPSSSCSARRPARGILLALIVLVAGAGCGATAFASSSSTSSASSTTLEPSIDDSSAQLAELHDESSFSAGVSARDARMSVEQYISSLVQKGEVSSDDFHVHGWRWHSLSFVRDAKRLERLALHLLKAGDDTREENGAMLYKAAEHVIDFNLAGLTNVENDVWFPWLRERLCGDKSTEIVAEEHRKQLGRIVDAVVEERDHLNRLAYAVRDQAKVASASDGDPSKRKEAITNVAEMSASLATRFQSLFETSAERILVPAVALIVPERDQRSVSNKVIRKLGVLDSRRHLVGMYDAVLDEGSTKERELFESEMPSLARAMIPRWRRKLYDPTAGMLDGLSVRDIRV